MKTINILVFNDILLFYLTVFSTPTMVSPLLKDKMIVNLS